MIAAGSTTIWELWSPLASQCHAWSTTPTFDLSTYVLGVTPLADGFAITLIAPTHVT
jgi:alpha-L-rhamnosidase